MKGKKKPLFWIIYIVLTLLFIAFWFWFINSVIIKDLKLYEASQSEYYMEEVAAKVQAGDLSDMTFEESASRFESADIYRETYEAKLSGKTITFEENPASYDTQAPLYELYADGEHVASVKLKAVSSESLMFILTLQTWGVDQITPIYETGNQSVTIEIPDTFTAYVNDVALSESELTGEAESYEEFEIVSQYVSVPSKVTYEVSGLLNEPAVKVLDGEGNEVACEVTDGVYSAGFEGSEVPEDIAETAIQNAKDISAIYAGDRTLSSVKSIFPDDSYLIPLFQSYINNDLWMYSGHATPEYSGEEASNYIKYSDDLYSVVVYFDKTMYLPKRDMTVTVTTHNTYYYALLDGTWKIVDMISMTE